MIDVLHHWLAATVIPKPLTTAIPATHIPSPLRKLASLGTLRRTKPSPPANHAHPRAHAPTRGRAGHRGVSRLPSVRGRGSSHAKNRRRRIGRSSWRRALILNVLLRAASAPAAELPVVDFDVGAPPFS